MQKNLHIKDLIDLEYFLKLDSDEITDTNLRKDISFERKIYLDHAHHQNPSYNRHDLIKLWLAEKRKTGIKSDNTLKGLPGDWYQETYSLLRLFIIVFALFTGITIAWSVLSYKGSDPVNIFLCLWIFIVPQLLLLIFLGGKSFLQRTGLLKSAKANYPVISYAIKRIINRMIVGLRSKGKDSLPGKHQLDIDAALGLIGQHKTIYGSVFYWPVFLLAQLFGLFFNIGLFLATFLKLSISDLAFGWQSTLLPNPETVYRLVSLFSLPWSWISASHPTIEQIEGSRLILKEGITGLLTTDLVSWWPFLCFSILFYGLIPRLVMLVAGYWQQKKALNRIDFLSSSCERIIQRMKTPHLKSSGKNYQPDRFKIETAASHEKSKIADALQIIDSMDPAVAFIPEEIDALCSTDDLTERAAYVLGLKVINRLPFFMIPEQDIAAFKALASEQDLSLSELRYIIIQEAWQPPIKEFMSWVKKLREAVGEKNPVVIGLIGKPIESMILTSPEDTDRIIWEKSVNKIGDPYIRVENLGG
jgi:hypothetical protein